MPRRVRSDEQEPKNRRILLAEAYKSMGRMNKAKSLIIPETEKDLLA
jgi:hypothetical protein